jgi:hypothetical protein
MSKISFQIKKNNTKKEAHTPPYFYHYHIRSKRSKKNINEYKATIHKNLGSLMPTNSEQKQLIKNITTVKSPHFIKYESTPHKVNTAKKIEASAKSLSLVTL